jgi:cytochrome c oxidase subunit 3
VREPRLAEQFEDLDKQVHAYRLGMWAFIASEALLFAGLFTLYAAYRVMYPAEFAEAVAHNDIVLGSVNTCILITSSLTVALSVHAIRGDHARRAGAFLAASIVLAIAFLVLKGTEYTEHFREGIFPGDQFRNTEMTRFGHKMFFTTYYISTGLHAIHVIIGIGVLGVLAVQCLLRRYSAASYVPVELGGLYWHLVDVIWIFLWPLLYLAR